MTVRTRFAPSPTGFMHVGNFRTGLFAYIFAKKMKGEFLIRIEDTDQDRLVEGSVEHILECFKWLGITPDEGEGIGGPYAPYTQSKRLDIYHKYARMLIDKKLAYVDHVSIDDLEALRKKAEEEKRPFLYRDHRPEVLDFNWSVGKPLRFKVPELKRYSWNDLVRGELSAGIEALDDYILIKSDGYPTYNFANIVDDYEMKITHVMRGEEYISSTPRYLSVYEALGITPPEIATMPFILGKDGSKKLSKRDGAKDILEYRTDGYLPESLINFLALLGWHPSEGSEILSLDEIVEQFDISRVQRSGAQFDIEKLNHINRHWLRHLSDDAYLKNMQYTGSHGDSIIKALPLIKERATTLSEARNILNEELDFIIQTPLLNASLLTQKEEVAGSTATHLRALETLIESLTGMSVEEIKNSLMPYADKEGRGAVLWPLRYALTGKEKSPDPFTVISILGKDESLKRVRDALSIV